jgi:hypothetical protein
MPYRTLIIIPNDPLVRIDKLGGSVHFLYNSSMLYFLSEYAKDDNGATYANINHIINNVMPYNEKYFRIQK